MLSLELGIVLLVMGGQSVKSRGSAIGCQRRWGRGWPFMRHYRNGTARSFPSAFTCQASETMLTEQQSCRVAAESTTNYSKRRNCSILEPGAGGPRSPELRQGTMVMTVWLEMLR